MPDSVQKSAGQEMLTPETSSDRQKPKRFQIFRRRPSPFRVKQTLTEGPFELETTPPTRRRSQPARPVRQGSASQPLRDIRPVTRVSATTRPESSTARPITHNSQSKQEAQSSLLDATTSPLGSFISWDAWLKANLAQATESASGPGLRTIEGVY